MFTCKRLLYNILITVAIVIAYARQLKADEIKPTTAQQKGFVENVGQIKDQKNKDNDQVKFLLPLSKGMNIQLKANSFSYDTYIVHQSQSGNERNRRERFKLSATNHKYQVSFHRVDVELLNANSSPRIITEYPSHVLHIYYNQTRSGPLYAHSYQKVTYKNIYPFIDLVCEAKLINGDIAFEYYFVVHPQGNVNQIRLKYKGALKTYLKEKKIYLSVNKGRFAERVPSSYVTAEKQVDVDELSGKNKINVNYEQVGVNTYGFTAPAYDKRHTLIIDPTPDLLWGTYLGGSDDDIGYAIAKDAMGNLFMVGTTDDDNLATSGVYQSQMQGPGDGMIAKYNAAGKLVWVTYYGGNNYDILYSVAVDKNNDVLVAGNAFSDNNITTAGAFEPVKKGPTWGTKAFIAKFSNDGVRKWATYVGGDGVETGYAIATDNENNVLLTGSTTSSQGIATPGAYQTKFIGSIDLQISDAYLVKFDASGNKLWGTYFGGADDDRGYGITVDKNDNIIITGLTYSTQAVASLQAVQKTIGSVAPQGGDGFVAKFNSTGALQWATYCGGGGGDYGWCAGTDSQNNIVIGGYTGSLNNIATANTQQPSTAANNYGDGFIIKYTPDGKILWGTYYGGSSTDYINGLAVDKNDNIWVTGSAGTNENISTPGTYQPLKGDYNCAFVAKFKNNGKRIWGTFYGTGGPYDNGTGYGITVTGDGEAAITGRTGSVKNISSCGAAQPNLAGVRDAFVAKLTESSGASTLPSVSIIADQGAPVCVGTLINFTAVPINGGSAPVFKWKVNGQDVGANSSIYSSTQIKNGDKVSCSIVSNSPCIVSNTGLSNVLVMVVNEPVTPAVTISASASHICSGTPVTFTAHPQFEGMAPLYQWKLNNNNTGNNSPVYLNNLLNDGDVISCTLTNPSGCVTNAMAVSNTVKMEVATVLTPGVSISLSNNNVCEGTPVTFKAQAQNVSTQVNYQWKVNGINAGTNSAAYAADNLKNGDFVQCEITDAASVCQLSAITSNSVTMIVNPIPIVTINANQTILKGKSTVLNTSASINIVKYEWSPASGLDDVGAASPLARPNQTTIYKLTATSASGCQATDSITIAVVTDIEIVNTFTPNNDGVNDTWDIKGLVDYSNCTVDIYTRYGQHIFHSLGYKQPWNGTYKNSQLPFGVYYYVINLKNGKKALAGNVTILR
ncbi:gliding motility-associated C-terminal domain-containing protein [Mucilaginibacter sp. KACC 22773]|uniref:DUF7948 domain-containing protein n=1 Tax=Mucilaginibacter sp. KACC 22773 TaxID=3025671 RepID=UPI002366ADF0|nr:gliding motility-associated C-terminal domain-containing protein [Mucilaginibacter sp. KACC 22773]WDF76537.1 gliding motility-associated C-terminal domain-containing protein [Mucilaginibacter sp. KACC 22773]